MASISFVFSSTLVSSSPIVAVYCWRNCRIDTGGIVKPGASEGGGQSLLHNFLCPRPHVVKYGDAKFTLLRVNLIASEDGGGQWNPGKRYARVVMLTHPVLQVQNFSLELRNLCGSAGGCGGIASHAFERIPPSYEPPITISW